MLSLNPAFDTLSALWCGIPYLDLNYPQKLPPNFGGFSHVAILDISRIELPPNFGGFSHVATMDISRIELPPNFVGFFHVTIMDISRIELSPSVGRFSHDAMYL